MGGLEILDYLTQMKEMILERIIGLCQCCLYGLSDKPI